MKSEIRLDPDPVIEAYKPGVDMTLVLENLKLTPSERLRRLQSAVDSYERLARQRSSVRPRREDS